MAPGPATIINAACIATAGLFGGSVIYDFVGQQPPTEGIVTESFASQDIAVSALDAKETQPSAVAAEAEAQSLDTRMHHVLTEEKADIAHDLLPDETAASATSEASIAYETKSDMLEAHEDAKLARSHDVDSAEFTEQVVGTPVEVVHTETAPERSRTEDARSDDDEKPLAAAEVLTSEAPAADEVMTPSSSSTASLQQGSADTTVKSHASVANVDSSGSASVQQMQPSSGMPGNVEQLKSSSALSALVMLISMLFDLLFFRFVAKKCCRRCRKQEAVSQAASVCDSEILEAAVDDTQDEAVLESPDKLPAEEQDTLPAEEKLPPRAESEASTASGENPSTERCAEGSPNASEPSECTSPPSSPRKPRTCPQCGKELDLIAGKRGWGWAERAHRSKCKGRQATDSEEAATRS